MSGIKRYMPGGRMVLTESALHGTYVSSADHEQAVVELRAEVEALRKDAERYRFLVETGAYAPGRHKSCPLALAMGAHGKCEKEELDAAIDRHMGADA